MEWQKSSFSSEGANCVEVATMFPGEVGIRESDEPRTVISTTPRRLAALLAGVRSDKLPE
ncbi:DUF397 domain-containing protein [Streptomyces sp. WMMC1477]|uniref:DUF397 domain-containing protein n=1 Tax=Streptomyces sp. WMMC1477 TaxID=3015155 RepID=UPI003FCE9379